MAELNCKRCVYEHDKCRNTRNLFSICHKFLFCYFTFLFFTATFPHSGQNIAITRSTGNETTDEEAIKKLFSDWFKENEYVEAWEIANCTHPK